MSIHICHNECHRLVILIMNLIIKEKKRQAELSKALFGHCVHLELPKQKVYKKEKNLSNKTINRGLKR